MGESGNLWMMGTVDVLTGEYEYTLDSKSRFLMPTEFRDYLGEPMYFVRGFENCIYVYSESQWQKMSEDIRNLPWSSDAARWVKRIWFSSSIKVKADPQGRVLVPQVYRDHADCVFPVLHGEGGEDGNIQGFLNVLGFPYVGSDVRASVICMDKYLTKLVAIDNGVPTPRYTYIYDPDNVPPYENVIKTIGSPFIVKP